MPCLRQTALKIGLSPESDETQFQHTDFHPLEMLAGLLRSDYSDNRKHSLNLKFIDCRSFSWKHLPAGLAMLSRQGFLA